MVYIERSITPYVQKAEKNFKAVLITGARQAGKSTLLKKLFPSRKYITFYLSLSQAVFPLLSWQDSHFVRSREILSISRFCPRWIMLWSVKKLQSSRKTSGRSFTEAAFPNFIRILSSIGSSSIKTPKVYFRDTGLVCLSNSLPARE